MLNILGWFQDEDAFWSDWLKIYFLVFVYFVGFFWIVGGLKGLVN